MAGNVRNRVVYEEALETLGVPERAGRTERPLRANPSLASDDRRTKSRRPVGLSMIAIEYAAGLDGLRYCGKVSRLPTG